MQNVFFHEVEAAYVRGRLQDAVIASGLAAQASSRRTQNRRPVISVLVVAYLRAREVFERQRPGSRLVPGGRELPAVQI